MNYRDTLFVNGSNKLVIGGIEASRLAKEYGTPLYVMDEQYIRDMCRAYANALKTYGGEKALFASKAFSCKEIYRIIASEGFGADVVTGGELYTALSAGLSPDKIYFHGNNKSAAEIDYAVKSGVYAIVADCGSEIDIINETAKKYNKTQNILLRLNPGVNAHTHDFVQTARVDSKFGFLIDGGIAANAVEKCLRSKNIKLSGVHTHIGSQIFETEPFGAAADKLCAFIKVVKDKYNYDIAELNMGGGYAVYYTENDRKLKPEDYSVFIKAICETINKCVEKSGIKKPSLTIEPGRSIVAEAGITLYTAGETKEIKGLKKYVTTDGGMFENPRFALYGAKYCAVKADDAGNTDTEIVTLAGKCCESGDLIAENCRLPKVKRGDIIAVFTTGAYNYSMAGNYNRNFVPPVVFVKDGKARYAVKPQSFEDLVRNDV